MRSYSLSFSREAYGALALQLKSSQDELQALCRESYRVTISLAATASPVEWAQVSREYDALRQLLDDAAAIGGALLVHGPAEHGEAEGRSANRIVAFVEEYTRRHIGEDLSLTRFAVFLFHMLFPQVCRHEPGGIPQRRLTRFVSYVIVRCFP